MNGEETADCGDTNGGCQEVLAELEAYLDGELPSASLDEIQRHLAACYPCSDRATFEQQLRALVRRGCSEQAPAGLLDRIRACLDDVAEHPSDV